MVLGLVVGTPGDGAESTRVLVDGGAVWVQHVKHAIGAPDWLGRAELATGAK
jgi:hypothetical protein